MHIFLTANRFFLGEKNLCIMKGPSLLDPCQGDVPSAAGSRRRWVTVEDQGELPAHWPDQNAILSLG